MVSVSGGAVDDAVESTDSELESGELADSDVAELVVLSPSVGRIVEASVEDVVVPLSLVVAGSGEKQAEARPATRRRDGCR